MNLSPLRTFVFVVILLLVNSLDAVKVNEDLRFNINWAGAQMATDLPIAENEETVIMKTKDHETYHCTLPHVPTDDDNTNGDVSGIHPLKLLSSLLNEGAKCSYRLEPYWTYEVCHGMHVRQFHEEKDKLQEIKSQEYYLGRLNEEDRKELLGQTDGQVEKIKTMKFDGRDTPYFAISMGNGTKCDLNSQPRHVKIIYICHMSSNNEVMSVKEVTTCDYEVVILTPLLCAHPAFKLKENPVYDIKCHPIDGAPSLPKGLMDHERESFLHNSGLSAQQVRQAMDAPRDGKIHVDMTSKTFEVKPNADIEPNPKLNPSASEVKPKADSSYVLEVDSSRHSIQDHELTRQFLAGEYCLQGGTGWWHYEFCFGRHVNQFHMEHGKKTTIMLGYWDEQLHLAWAKTKTKIKTESTLSLMYSNGEFCELTGRNRVAQVKLKCKKDQPGQPMSIYLVEPSPCSYIIGVESPILCSVIEKADDTGIIPK